MKDRNELLKKKIKDQKQLIIRKSINIRNIYKKLIYLILILN